MPKVAKPLGALAVSKLKHPSGSKVTNHYVAVGTVAGLLLQITPSNSRSWLLRVSVGGKRREIGLGAYPEISLSAAHDLAREAKEKIRNGVDPVAERQAARAALVAERKRSLTFADAVEHYLETPYMRGLPSKQQGLWRATLTNYALPVVGSMAVADIGATEVKQVLAPIWNDKRETARRVRSRIDAVISWAIDRGHREGQNPAALSALKQWIKDYSTEDAGKKSNRDALAVSDAPAWFAELRARGGVESQALQFLAYTAARSGEVREASWDEIDFEARTWTVPAARMKMKRDHTVALSYAAISLLNALPRFEGTNTVFVGRRGGFFNQNALLNLMKEMSANRNDGWLDPRTGKDATPHGLRSTFKDWAIEKTEYDSELSEIALAHKVGSNVEQAYRRGNMVEKRRAMMQDWAKYLNSAKLPLRRLEGI